jgi:hypothetical protein
MCSKSSQALHELATGAGPIRERLRNAAVYLTVIRPENISQKDLRYLFAGIKDDLTFDEPSGDEGRLAGTSRLAQASASWR